MGGRVRALIRDLVPFGGVRLGSLRRTTPISGHWGTDRGTAIDRYYIERFLSDHRWDIGGRVLEVKDSRYTEKFGMDVTRSDVLDIDPRNPAATVVADLAATATAPSDSFDCFVLTQTLHWIYAVEAAVQGARRFLRLGGVLLVTVPAVSRIDLNAGPEGDFWRFTEMSCRRLFGDVFGEEHVRVTTFGNVLASIGFLAGLAREDLSDAELDEHDPLFPVIVGVRAVKA